MSKNNNKKPSVARKPVIAKKSIDYGTFRPGDKVRIDSLNNTGTVIGTSDREPDKYVVELEGREHDYIAVYAVELTDHDAEAAFDEGFEAGRNYGDSIVEEIISEATMHADTLSRDYADGYLKGIAARLNDEIPSTMDHLDSLMQYKAVKAAVNV